MKTGSEPNRSQTGAEQELTAALRLALPVMRRTAMEYLMSVTVRMDPITIAPSEWDEIRPDLEAIVAAEAAIGRVPDRGTDWGDSDWLNRILDARKWESA